MKIELLSSLPGNFYEIKRTVPANRCYGILSCPVGGPMGKGDLPGSALMNFPEIWDVNV